LRVRAAGNPAAAGYVGWPLEDRAALGSDALGRRTDIGDIKVVKPEGDRRGRRLIEHAANRLPRCGELLVCASGTDIGDLHQTVNDKQSGKTYHVQAASGSTSTIRNGDTVMYTQSISGNLFGLIPITFSPDNPPPLNIPLIYFTNVKVVQAGQFGGTLTVPGLRSYQN